MMLTIQVIFSNLILSLLNNIDNYVFNNHLLLLFLYPEIGVKISCEHAKKDMRRPN